MKLKLTATAFLICAVSFAQDYSLEWGKKVKTKHTIQNIHFTDDDSFFAEAWKLKKKSVMLYYDNLTLHSTTLYNAVVNNKATDFEGIHELNGKMYVFTSQDNKEKTEKTLYVHEFKRAPEYIKIEGKPIASFAFDNKNKRRTSFKLTTSSNKKKLCVNYYSNPKKEKNSDEGRYGYFIFDENLKLENEGSFKDIFEDQKESVSRYFLSNAGTLFLVTQQTAENQPFTVRFYKVTGENVDAIELNLKDKYINQLRIIQNEEGQFVVSGFYGNLTSDLNKLATGIRGVFFAIIAPETGELVNSGFNEFEDAFIQEGFNKRELKKSEKNEKKGVEPSLQNFVMRHFSTSEGGESFGIAEEKYVTQHTRTDRNGLSTTEYIYHYNDIIVFKLNADGELVWKKKILKTQVSNIANQLSFLTVMKGEKAYLFFIDANKNYDQNSGKYIGESEDKRWSGSAYALCEIDFKEEEITRESIDLGKEGDKLALIISKSRVDQANNAMLLYFQGNKGIELFGKMSFED